jgi:AcrR family transcriptional regulator
MDGFERRKEQSKEDIRRAAEELFSRFGANKVTINEIARKAGVSQATIYNNFGDKDGLVKDYYNSVKKLLATRFRNILLMKKSWAEKFGGVVQSWLDAADQYQFEKTNQGQTGKSGMPSTSDMGTELEDAFREFLKEGRKQGNLRSDISDEAIITYIRFFQRSIASNPAIYNRIKHDSKFSQELVSLFIYGISGKKK